MEHGLKRESHKLLEEGIDKIPNPGQTQSPEIEHRKKWSLKLAVRFQQNLNFQLAKPYFGRRCSQHMYLAKSLCLEYIRNELLLWCNNINKDHIKMGKWLCTYFIEKYMNGEQAHERSLSIISHGGRAHSNHSPHPSRRLKLTRLATQRSRELPGRQNDATIWKYQTVPYKNKHSRTLWPRSPKHSQKGWQYIVTKMCVQERS